MIRPLDIEHVAPVTNPAVEPVIEAPEQVSTGLNPPPEIVTTVAMGVAVEDRVIVGVLIVTVNRA
jgi:hypothetical protein